MFIYLEDFFMARFFFFVIFCVFLLFYSFYCLLLLFFWIIFLLVFFFPNYLVNFDNYIPSNPLSTPPHIVPEWYFLPFYCILRSVPDKIFGVFLLLFSIISLAILPFIRSVMYGSSLLVRS